MKFLRILLVGWMLLTPALAGPVSSVIMKGGEGGYFVDDGGGVRQVDAVHVDLEEGGQAVIKVDLGEDGFTVLGEWHQATDDSVTLTLKQAFEDPVTGTGAVILDEPIDNGGTAWHINLQFQPSTQKTFHTLYYSNP